MISVATMRSFTDELGKHAALSLKMLSDPKVAPYLERIARGGKKAPRLFKGGPPVNIPGVSPAKKVVQQVAQA